MKKLFKILGFIILTLFFLVLLALFLIDRYGPSYVTDLLTEKVRTETRGRYYLSIGSFDLDLWSFSVELTDLRFNRDTLVDTLSGIHVLDEYDIEAGLKAFQLRDLNLAGLWKGGDLDLDELRLAGPAIRIRKNITYDTSLAAVDTIVVDSMDFETFSDSAARHIPIVEIGAFTIEDASFAFYDGKSESPELIVSGLSAGLTDFHSKRLQPILSANPLIRVDTASALISRGLARITFTGMELTDSLLHLDSIHYGNIVNPYRINRLKGFRTGWLDIKGSGLNVRGIDYRRMATDSALAIRNISLDQFNFIFFKDKSDTRLNQAHKPLPAESIRNIPIPVKIDTLQLNRGNMEIQMQSAIGNAPGRLIIGAVNAQVLNLTNIPDELAEDPYLGLNIKARMMNYGPIDLKGRFRIDSPEDQYEIKAVVGAMPITSLNDFLGSQFFFQFASGELKSMRLEYTGNDRFTKGELDLEYTGLKIAKLENFKKFRATQPKNGFLITMGNWVLPKDHNRTQKSYKTGIVYYEKPYNRDVVHCLVESMLSGIVSNLGYGPRNMEKVEKKAVRNRAKKQKVDG